MRRQIYLVEDEADLGEILVCHLEGAGYSVTRFGRGDEALSALVDAPPDLAILDIMLPGLDGLEVLKHVRQKSRLPIILISARKTEFDRVLGIELGADDYLPKPFSARELVARIKAVLRRTEREKAPSATPTRVLEWGPLQLDLERQTLALGEGRVELTLSEFEMLRRMMATPGKVFSRDELLDRATDSRAVDMHITNLRRKMRDLGTNHALHSIRGVGYRFGD
ncbi:MAG: response regulator transcription factor [Vulcanimicrobiota bacterium]